MPIFNTCPKCGKYGRLTQDDNVGWPVRCPVCQTRFIAKDYPIGRPAPPPVGPGDPAPKDETVFPRVGADIPKLIGRFQIRFWLGRGSFGDVYQAYDPVLEREVALKVPKAKMLNPERVARFLREAKSAARLRHPHIVPVFDSGQDGDRYYIATAFIDGLSLDQELPKRPLGFVQIAKLVRALAEALAYAHSQGIVHRDIKPANIMVDKKGEPYLVDFGLAGRLDGQVETDHPSDDDGDLENADPKMTQRAEPMTTNKRVRMGTPSYWSPEQAHGVLENVKAPTDQYSLGMVLYEMLCGHPAFNGPPILLQAHAQKTPPPPPRSIKPLIPEDLEAICLKTLAKKPEERYPSCQEFADDLRRWLEGKETQVRPLPARERVVRWCKKEPLRAWAVAFAGVAVLAVIILSIQFGVQEALSARRIRDALEAAQASAQRANDNERETKIVLSGFTLDRAQMLGEQHETGLATLWLARSLEIAQDAKAKDLEHVIRRNFSAWSRSMHALRISGRFPKQVHALVYHPDGKRFFYGADGEVLEGSMSRYQWSEGNRVQLPLDGIAADQAPLRALALTADGKELLIARGSRIYRVDPESGANPLFAKAVYSHAEQIVALAVPPAKDAAWAAFIDAKGTAGLWNLSNDKKVMLLRDLNVFSPDVLSLAFSPCGQAILLGCADGTARVWSLATKREDWVIAGKDPINAVAFHPDGKRLLLARSKLLSGQAELWSVTERKRLATFPHQAEVHAVGFSPCGKILVTASRDRSARLWDVKTHQPLGHKLYHPAEVTHAVFHPTKRALVTVDSDRTVRLWEVKQENLKPTFSPRFPPNVTALAANPDGKVSLALVIGNKVQLEDAEDGQIGMEFDPRLAFGQARKGDDIQVTAVAVHENLMATAALLTPKDEHRGKKAVVQLWDDMKRDKPPRTFHGHTDRIFRVAISPKGDTLASVGWDGKLYLWDPNDDAKPLFQPDKKDGKLFALAYSANGEKLIVGGTDHHGRIYDLRDVTKPPVLLKHPDSVLSAVFSPDQQYVLTGFVGGAMLWDLNTGKAYPLQHLTGVFAVAFSPDGKTMVTAGSDHQARLWDRATRKQIGPPLEHPDLVFTAALTDTAVVTGTRPPFTTIHHWPISPPATESADELSLQARVISNINLDQHNTNQVLDGASWIKLNEKVKNPEKWRESWGDWAKPPDASDFQPLPPKQDPVAKVDPLPKEVAKEKIDPNKTPEIKPAPIKGDKEIYTPTLQEVLNVEWLKGHSAALQGAWKVVSFETPGQKNIALAGATLDVDKDGKNLTLKILGQMHNWTFKLNPAGNPKEIDIFQNDQKFMVGIYVLEKGTLKICLAPEGKGRPTQFAFKEGTNHTHITLERAK